DAGRGGEAQHLREHSRSRFVDARAQRNEFEDEINDSVDRFENESGQDSGRDRIADERQRQIAFGDPGKVKAHLNQQDEEKPRMVPLVESVDAIFQSASAWQRLVNRPSRDPAITGEREHSTDESPLPPDDQESDGYDYYDCAESAKTDIA